MKHILVDYENIRPQFLATLESPEDYQIWFFLGKYQQKTLPLSLVEALFRFEKQHVHFIKIHHQSKNLLDHYLSFYLGKISERDQNAQICILSKDHGYDVLIEQIQISHKNIEVIRLASLVQLEQIWTLDTKQLNDKENNTKQTKDKQGDDKQQIKNEPPDKNNVLDIYPEIDEDRLTTYQPRSTVIADYQIKACYDLVFRKMCSKNTFLPSFKSNFYHGMRKLLADETYGLDNEETNSLLNLVYEKLVNNEIIVEKDNKLTYQVSNYHLLKMITKKMVQQRPKNLKKFKNLLTSITKSLNISFDDSEMDSYLDYLVENNQIITVSNHILYKSISSDVEVFLFVYKKTLAYIKQIHLTMRPETLNDLKIKIQALIKPNDAIMVEKIIKEMVAMNNIELREDGKIKYHC